jgi:hypothetical protein
MLPLKRREANKEAEMILELVSFIESLLQL